MSNGDATQGHAVTPEEFAKLMGAYPQPAENPLPTYGGYMDNSPANFSWVQNNDYFGAEEDEVEALKRALRATMEALSDCEADGGIDEREIDGLLAAHPIMERLNMSQDELEQMIHDAGYPEVKEAPYGGAGSLMDIGKETPLDSFTTTELTTSSAIHGDFDEASLNYSGHQNLEVRAEMEVVTDGMAVISNTNNEMVGAIEVLDDEDDEEMVEVSIQDENLDEIGSFTLDDGNITDDFDDYLAETKKSSMLPLAIGMIAGVLAFPKVTEFFTKKEEKAADTPEMDEIELIENPNTGNLDPAQYEEMVVESTGFAVDVIPQVLDGSFMGSRFQALPTERYVDYNEPGIGAHTDIALNRNTMYLEPEMAMVQASENVIKEAQAPGQSPYNSITGEENPDFDMRVLKETEVVSLDPAVKPFIPQSMSGYTGNANTPPSVLNKMFNTGVLGQTPAFVPGSGDMGASRTGSRNSIPNTLGLGGSVGGPLSDQVNASYTDGTTSMSLAQWSIENTVSQTSDTEAVVIDRSSGLMKRVRRV